ncbi:MAG: hypothetical protein A2Y23_12615 [Clostridiales bacterium GWB2_37_7]|nr:MAG: hypothetical protein A2Y23_12615 [Clostridiales bacterium GWB2_37_7]
MGFLLIFTVLIARKSITLSLKLLKEAGCVMENYRGNEVVFGMGIAFIPIIISSELLVFLMYSNQLYIHVFYLFAICAIGFAGLLDDLIGNRKIKGLKNHITSFFRGQLTTGFIKAFIGVTSSIIISIGISMNILDFTLNIFNMALFTNALNLMDLRPGRCIKIFLAIGMLILFVNLKDAIILLPLIIILVSSIVYMSYDLRELCMLGDTGSNIFGITLGYFSSVEFETTSKILIFLALITINFIAEKVSITEIISNNRIFNYLDSLGRSRG